MSWEMRPVFTCAVCGKEDVGRVYSVPIFGQRLMAFGKVCPPWEWKTQGGPDGVSVCKHCRSLLRTRGGDDEQDMEGYAAKAWWEPA